MYVQVDYIYEKFEDTKGTMGNYRRTDNAIAKGREGESQISGKTVGKRNVVTALCLRKPRTYY